MTWNPSLIDCVQTKLSLNVLKTNCVVFKPKGMKQVIDVDALELGDQTIHRSKKY